MSDNEKSSYTPAMKKAIYRYRENNRDKYNEYQRNYHNNQMLHNEEYRERKRLATIKATEKRKLKMEEEKKEEKKEDKKEDFVINNEEKEINDDVDFIAKYFGVVEN